MVETEKIIKQTKVERAALEKQIQTLLNAYTIQDATCFACSDNDTASTPISRAQHGSARSYDERAPRWSALLHTSAFHFLFVTIANPS